MTLEKLVPDANLVASLAQHAPPQGFDEAGVFQHRHEVIGQYQATAWVRPTQQRLRAGDHTGLQGHDGLVMKLEFTALYGLPQAHFEVQQSHGAVMHLTVEDLPPRATFDLGAVHGSIRITQQVLGFLPSAAESDADTCRREQHVSPQGY